MSRRIDEIRHELALEEKQITEIRDIIENMKRRVLDKEPDHFCATDIVYAFFSALIIGLTFIFKGAIISTAKALDLIHIEMILFSTFIILAAEIYFVGYKRVKDKTRRGLSQFITKRFASLFLVGLFTSFFLVYIFNVDHHLSGFDEVLKLVILMTMPCTIGAAIPSILKKY